MTRSLVGICALCLVVLALGGCAAPRPMPKAVVEKFIGEPLSAARAAWGEPVSEEPLEGGTRRVMWVYEAARVSRTGQGAPEQQGPFLKAPRSDLPELVIDRCRLELTVDEAGLVRAWSAEGPACIHALARPEVWPRSR